MTSNLPRELKTQATKDKVIAATARLIEEQGYEYLTVRNLCQEAGVAYGSFYYHFGSKEDLLYGFCKDRLVKMLEANPLPQEIDENNIIHTVLWTYLVYAKFCESMGKGVIGCIYTQCASDLFEELCFEDHIFSRILMAVDNDYLRIGGQDDDFRPSAVTLMNIKRDLTVQLKGTVLYWATVNDKHTAEGLSYLLEGPINRFMMSWRSEKYREEFSSRNYRVVSDMPWFKGKIVVPYTPAAQVL